MTPAVENKPRALVFYQYLPPWRVDLFNEMGRFYYLTIAFTDAERSGFTYDREELLARLHGIRTVFLSRGFRIGSRPVRFGIVGLLREYAPEIVFSHEYSATSLLLALCRKRFGFRYIVTTSDNAAMAESCRGLKAVVRSLILHRAEAVVVYSHAVKAWYEKRFPELHIRVCPNIQNPESLRQYRSDFPSIGALYREKFGLRGFPVILYVGRLMRVKGLDLLLGAFAEMADRKPKLVLVGEGEERDALQAQAAALGIADRVVLAGYYHAAELYAWYDMAEFLVLPSRYEPFGAVVNEALVLGCPVVASRQIGALDYIDTENGIIFDPLDHEAFIATLNTAAERFAGFNPQKRNLMRRSFGEYAENLDFRCE